MYCSPFKHHFGILGKASDRIHDKQKSREPEKYLMEAYEKLKNIIRDIHEFENNPRNIKFNSDMVEILQSENQRTKNLKLANYIRKIGDELKNMLD